MENQQKAVTPSVILLMLFFIVVVPFLPLLISGQWDWREAWVYGILSVLAFAVSRLLAARRNPDLIGERARTFQQENAVPWDKKIVPIIGLVGGVVMVLAGLDARFGWSPVFSMPVILLGLAAILAGFVLSSYALIENRFFSGVVRLQVDRDQRVVSSGPYRWVRHPGYIGAIIANLGTPFFLNSLWALIPTLFLVVLMIFRTSMEDRFLQGALDGYRDYAASVRYRLLPGVW